MTSDGTNSIAPLARSNGRKLFAGTLRQAGAAVADLVRLLLHSANAMVFLGFSYAAALIATTFFRQANRTLKTLLLG